MSRVRVFGVLFAGVMLLGACGLLDDDAVSVDGSTPDQTVGGSVISIADARITVRSERDVVTVNGDALASGSFQEGASGDQVEVDGAGTAVITAEQVVEIEALRSANLTVPDLTSNPLDVKLEVGHVFVRLNAEANASIVVDAGERKFITRSPDAEFALCQAPDGASCLAVLAGSVEWLEDGVASETYSAGEASFAARGDAPDPPRCATQTDISDMQRNLRGQDFEGALATIVATWDPCPEGGADGSATLQEVTVPSAARMERVELAEIVIGSPDVTADSPTAIAQRTLDGSADFYIEPLTVTNGEFRTWLVTAAGDDAGAWRRFAPADWLERAPGGAATQATYAAGDADLPVKGVAYTTAIEFCASQAKRLPTEVEWELAAVAGVLEDLLDESQDWVTDWESYGPGPDESDERQVLRGANATLQVDPYYRVFAVDSLEATAARKNARIRCAATEVALGGQTYENIVFRDDFNGLGWTEYDEDPFELGYHPENFHLDVTGQHAAGAVVRSLAEPITDGRIDIDLFIERNNTGTGVGKYRFGAIFGTPEQMLTATVQPDEFTADRFTACVMPAIDELVTELELGDSLSPSGSGRPASIGPDEGLHAGEDCIDAAASVEVPVASIDSPLRLSLVLGDGVLEVWVNVTLVQSSSDLTSIDVYGFYSQAYHRPRTHIHYDDVIISTT